LNRDRTLRFRVNVVEEAEIEGCARNAGLSLSALLRAGALNHPIRSLVDLKALADRRKINGDLGRVAGLLKLWLEEKNGQGARYDMPSAKRIENLVVSRSIQTVAVKPAR